MVDGGWDMVRLRKCSWEHTQVESKEPKLTFIITAATTPSRAKKISPKRTLSNRFKTKNLAQSSFFWLPGGYRSLFVPSIFRSLIKQARRWEKVSKLCLPW